METNCVRQTIINSASTLFYKNGYNNTQISEILETSGVSKSTLYDHFNTKEEICIAHLQHRNDEFSKQVMAYTSQAPQGKDRIMAVFHYLELFYKMEDFNGCWSIKVFSEVPMANELIKSEVISQKNGFIDYIEMLLIENIKVDNLEDHKILAQKIYMLLEGAVAQSNLHKKEWPITLAKEMCYTLFD
ncbi:TetR/AcrR family transcriptional regulator [Dokdonia sp.]|uniref:TetR/AcrR family transcriptional regulator n=1 Tax=Dokdonia sp. TaxID=2024995 RepID=UPI0032646460